MRGLENKVALVTGGASGLGKAIALRLVSEGARVVITDIQRELGDRTAAQLKATFLAQDVSDESRWIEVIDAIEKQFGRLDILVNNAGIVGATDLVNPENTRLADWKRIFAVNVDGVFLGCRAGVAAMRRTGGGAIINISSIAGLMATPYATAYGASKATVRQLTKSVAQHCAEYRFNIRCNSIHPGSVRTELMDSYAEITARARGLTIEQMLDDMRSTIPMGDFTQPEDVAAAVAFLASDESQHVTGAKIVVDGGVIHCDSWRTTRKIPPAEVGNQSGPAKGN